MKRLNVNLASAPFVNRYVLSGTLGLIVVAALVLTTVNAVSFYVLGRSYRAERKTLNNQEVTLSKLNREIAEKKAMLAGGKASALSGETQFIGRVLAAKRFSWITFLGDLERVKPYGVMFLSVSPSFTKEGTIVVSLGGVGNKRDQLLKLESNLFSDSVFRKVRLSQEQKKEGSPWTTFHISVEYIPEAMRGH